MSGSALIDLEIDSATEDEVRGRVPVTDALKQPLGLVHGGVYAVIADALTAGDGRVITNQTSFLRPATEGMLHAVARRRHGGRTTAVWEVDVSDDAGRLCAVVRTTVPANRRGALAEPGLDELLQLRVVGRVGRAAAAPGQAPARLPGRGAWPGSRPGPPRRAPDRTAR